MSDRLSGCSTPPEWVRLARDPQRDGRSFDPSAPLSLVTLSGPPLVVSVALRLPLRQVREFESFSLRRGVSCKADFLDQGRPFGIRPPNLARSSRACPRRANSSGGMGR